MPKLNSIRKNRKFLKLTNQKLSIDKRSSEKRHNIKLKEKANNAKTCKQSKPAALKKQNEQSDSRKIEKIYCSICSLEIHHYIPEYFFCEKYKPTCETCRKSDSSMDFNDPFSSFPDSTRPIS